MRLTPREIEQIKHNVAEVFGVESRVFVFGSRVDDTKKGGDIDLYIESEKNQIEQEIRLRAKLQMSLGEQKIDVVLAKDPKRLIEQEAKRTGILL